MGTGKRGLGNVPLQSSTWTQRCLHAVVMFIFMERTFRIYSTLCMWEKLGIIFLPTKYRYLITAHMHLYVCLETQPLPLKTSLCCHTWRMDTEERFGTSFLSLLILIQNLQHKPGQSYFQLEYCHLFLFINFYRFYSYFFMLLIGLQLQTWVYPLSTFSNNFVIRKWFCARSWKYLWMYRREGLIIFLQSNLWFLIF